MALDQRDLWDMYTRSGKEFLRLRNYAEAQRMFKAALQTAEGFGPADPRLGVALNNLARLHQVRRRWADAEALYQRALDLALRARGENHPDTAVNLANLAGLYHAQGLFPRAEPLYRKAIETFGRTVGEDHPGMARILEAYASLLAKMGRLDEAAKAKAWAEDIRARRGDAEPS